MAIKYAKKSLQLSKNKPVQVRFYTITSDISPSHQQQQEQASI